MSGSVDTLSDVESGEGDKDGETDEHPCHQVVDVDATAHEDEEHRQRQDDGDDDAADRAVRPASGPTPEGQQHPERER